MSTNSRRVGNLTYADGPDISVGRKSLIRADGRDNEPHCLSATVEKTGNAEISTGDKTYVHHLRDFKETLGKSIDKTTFLQYTGSALEGRGLPSLPLLKKIRPLGRKPVRQRRNGRHFREMGNRIDSIFPSKVWALYVFLGAQIKVSTGSVNSLSLIAMPTS